MEESIISKLRTTLHHQVTTGQLYPSYMMLGEGGKELAIYVAKLANCLGVGSDPCPCNQCKKIEQENHTDFKIFRSKEEKGKQAETIGIDIVRTIITKSLYRPAEGKYRFFIVEDAFKLTEDAQNALLKILEEPPSFTSLVLLGKTEGQFLDTVVSRCHVVRIMKDKPLEAIEKTFAAEFNVLEIIKKVIIKREVDLPAIFTELDRERTKTKGKEELEHLQKWVSSGFYGKETGQWILSPTTLEEAKWWRHADTKKLTQMSLRVHEAIQLHKRHVNENLIWRTLVIDLRGLFSALP